MKKSIYTAISFATLAALSYTFNDSTLLIIDKDSKDFIGYLSKNGKSYPTNAEFKFRLKMFK